MFFFSSSRESYGDNAIGYVIIKRTGDLCTVRARITPEHRVRNKNYNAEIVVDEKNLEVKDISCGDCNAADGGCKHAMALLMWVHRKSENPSPTEIECYWKKPKLSEVGTNQKFILATELIKKHRAPVEKNFISAKKKKSSDQPNLSTFFEDVMKKAKEKEIDSQISRYHFTCKGRELYAMNIQNLLWEFGEKFDFKNLNVSNFLNYASLMISDDVSKKIEVATRDQSNSPLWFDLRYGRITASKLYEAAKCKTKDGALVQQILGISKKYDNVFMQRGRMLEKKVISTVEKLQKININPCGLIIIGELSFFGASSDGLSEVYVVEVKCPGSEKTFKNYVSENGEIKPKFKAQIMMQMFATKKKKGLFCVADPEFEKNNVVNVFPIDFDEKFIMPLILDAIDFWKENIFEKLLKSVIP